MDSDLEAALIIINNNYFEKNHVQYIRDEKVADSTKQARYWYFDHSINKENAITIHVACDSFFSSRN
jgi:hypothetical protein